MDSKSFESMNFTYREMQLIDFSQFLDLKMEGENAQDCYTAEAGNRKSSSDQRDEWHRTRDRIG